SSTARPRFAADVNFARRYGAVCVTSVLYLGPNGGRSVAGAAAPQGTRQTPAYASRQGGEGGEAPPSPHSGEPNTRKTLLAAHAPRKFEKRRNIKCAAAGTSIAA